jgi:glycosyltransferase involved in cell wall biosynthesis
MVRAFEELTHKYSGLQLTLLGGVAPKRSSVNYLRKVSERVGSKNVSVRPDASRKSVMSEVRRSNLYWHAAGLGVGNDEPWRMEHFGIAPVEACQMGVLPLVPDNGGVGANLRQLSDICVYRDIDELVAKTSAIIDGTIAPLSEEEIKEFGHRFSVARFNGQWDQILESVANRSES